MYNWQQSVKNYTRLTTKKLQDKPRQARRELGEDIQQEHFQDKIEKN